MPVLRTPGISMCTAALLALGAGTTGAGAAPLSGIHGMSGAQGTFAIKVHDDRYRADDDDDHRRHGRHHRSNRHHDRYDGDDDVVVDAPYTHVEHGGRVVVEAPFTSVYVGRYGSRIQAPFVDLWIPR